jgi:hypothetical protein
MSRRNDFASLRVLLNSMLNIVNNADCVDVEDQLVDDKHDTYIVKFLHRDYETKNEFDLIFHVDVIHGQKLSMRINVVALWHGGSPIYETTTDWNASTLGYIDTYNSDSVRIAIMDCLSDIKSRCFFGDTPDEAFVLFVDKVLDDAILLSVNQIGVAQ